MFREAESFFTSLGLPAMTPEFWNYSLIEMPEDGRQLYSGPLTYDLHNKRDFRYSLISSKTTLIEVDRAVLSQSKQNYFKLLCNSIWFILSYNLVWSNP